jgi:hypothetical protein
MGTVFIRLSYPRTIHAKPGMTCAGRADDVWFVCCTNDLGQVTAVTEVALRGAPGAWQVGTNGVPLRDSGILLGRTSSFA